MPKQKLPKGSAAAANNGENATDKRFSNFQTDPRFRLPSKKHTRTKIDKRFARMLNDDEFTNAAKVDRYGRKIKDAGKKKEALRRLYEEEDEEEDEDGKVEVEVEKDDVVEKELARLDAAPEKAYDPARGGGFSSSEDDSDDEDEEEPAVEDESALPETEIEHGDVPTGEVTRRIAIVNLDWDNVKSTDLMAVFQSFVPTGGRIEKISIYPSEFGKERMEREDFEGPPKELFRKKVDEDEDDEEEDSEDEDDEDGVEDEDDEEGEEGEEGEDDDEDAEEEIKKDLLQEDEGQEVDSGALRKYQIDRLRYYYAIMTCSDENTAQKIYEATDGTEYLSSANFFDLRFVPDDTEFDDTPRDECTSVPADYKPVEFVTEALTHSKVKMSWDADDNSRKAAINKAFSGSRSELNENDLRAYIGNDSSSEEEDEVAEEVAEDEDKPKLSKKELARQKMRAALGLGDEPLAKSKSGPVGDMEITFTAGLSSKEKGSVFENEPIKERTTAEAYIRKEKERKARRKERAKAKREGRDPDAAIAEESKEAEPVEQEQEDLGFDDPFFDLDGDDKKAKTSKSALRKEERKKRREQKEAEAEAEAKERAKLQSLLDDGGEEDHLDHFDINEIVKAEKAKGKKSKKLVKKAEERAAKRGGLQEGFEMDTSDPRFKAVFESHEYAIDPSNPKFKATEGMKKLLDEGRKKRKNAVVDVEEEVPKKSKKRKNEDGVEQSDLKSLVDAVKKKTKR